MRFLLDECLPKDLAREIPGHTVKTVPQAGWASISNGKLPPELKSATEDEIRSMRWQGVCLFVVAIGWFFGVGRFARFLKRNGFEDASAV